MDGTICRTAETTLGEVQSRVLAPHTRLNSCQISADESSSEAISPLPSSGGIVQKCRDSCCDTNQKPGQIGSATRALECTPRERLQKVAGALQQLLVWKPNGLQVHLLDAEQKPAFARNIKPCVREHGPEAACLSGMHSI